jgi:hypothetical protein
MPRLRRPRDELIVRIAATPLAESDGPRLADEVLAAIAPVTREAEDIELHHDGGAGGTNGDDDAAGKARFAPADAPGRRLTGERDGHRRDPVTQEYES